MAMGLVSEEVFEAEIKRIEKGRGAAKNVPMTIRKIAAETALIEGRTAAIAEELGISKSSVDAYKHGATSTASYNEPQEELKNHIDTVRDEATTTARSKLKMALEAITAEKLEKANLKTASSVARDMSTIIKNLETDEKEKDDNVKFVFFAPAIKKVEQFKIIDVRE